VILFLAANPSDIDRLTLDREACAIHIERSGYRDLNWQGPRQLPAATRAARCDTECASARRVVNAKQAPCHKKPASHAPRLEMHQAWDLADRALTLWGGPHHLVGLRCRGTRSVSADRTRDAAVPHRAAV